MEPNEKNNSSPRASALIHSNLFMLMGPCNRTAINPKKTPKCCGNLLNRKFPGRTYVHGRCSKHVDRL